MLRILVRIRLIMGIPFRFQLFSPQQLIRVLNGLVPGFHPEGRGAGAVDRRRVAQRGEQEDQIGVVRIAHEPLRLRLGNALKIHIFQNLAHHLATAAGNEPIRCVGEQHLCHFPPAVFRAGADADSVSRIGVRSAHCPEAFLLQDLLGMIKPGPIRLDVAAKGRCGKSDGVSVP